MVYNVAYEALRCWRLVRQVEVGPSVQYVATLLLLTEPVTYTNKHDVPWRLCCQARQVVLKT